MKTIDINGNVIYSKMSYKELYELKNSSPSWYTRIEINKELDARKTHTEGVYDAPLALLKFFTT